jgi:hypothetical protein
MKLIKFFLILVVLLSSCEKVDTTGLESTAEPPLAEGLSPAPATSIPTELPSKADVKVEHECPTVETINSDMVSDGILILDSRVDDGNERYKSDTYMMKMQTMEVTQINKPGKNLENFISSPNRKWIAYIDSDSITPDPSFNLVIANSDNEVYTTLLIEDRWGAINWLDNEHLIIGVSSQDITNSLGALDLGFLVLNPFTGERAILQTDYPNIYSPAPKPNWDGWGVTAYNSALTKVVYLQGGESPPWHYVLWDTQYEKQVASFEVVFDFQAVPRWSPDGQQFAFSPSLSSRAKKYPSYELYSVTRDGNIHQLTHLSDYYPWVYIADLSWSPDSRYIAFWFSYWENQKPSFDSTGTRYLAILDTTTSIVTSYCLNGESNASIGSSMYPPPLWSPDSKQIIVQNQIAADSFQTILIDIEKNHAFHIADNLKPVGWMISP